MNFLEVSEFTYSGSLEKLGNALGYQKNHPSRDFNELNRAITHFLAEYEARGTEVPPNKKRDIEEAQLCALHFLMEDDRAERLFPESSPDGAPCWERDRDKIMFGVAHMFRVRAFFNYQKRMRMALHGISPKRRQVQKRQRQRRRSFDETGINERRVQKRKRPRQPSFEETDILDCEYEDDDCGEVVLGLEPYHSLRPWMKPPERVNSVACARYIKSLDPRRNTPILTEFAQFSKDGAILPPSVDKRLQRFMHERDFYFPVELENQTILELVNTLREGSSIDQFLTVPQYTSFTARLAAQIEFHTNKFAELKYISYQFDGRARKTARFQQLWSNGEAIWKARPKHASLSSHVIQSKTRRRLISAQELKRSRLSELSEASRSRQSSAVESIEVDDPGVPNSTATPIVRSPSPLTLMVRLPVRVPLQYFGNSASLCGENIKPDPIDLTRTTPIPPDSGEKEQIVYPQNFRISIIPSDISSRLTTSTNTPPDLNNSSDTSHTRNATLMTFQPAPDNPAHSAETWYARNTLTNEPIFPSPPMSASINTPETQCSLPLPMSWSPSPGLNYPSPMNESEITQSIEKSLSPSPAEPFPPVSQSLPDRSAPYLKTGSSLKAPLLLTHYRPDPPHLSTEIVMAAPSGQRSVEAELFFVLEKRKGSFDFQENSLIPREKWLTYNITFFFALVAHRSKQSLGSFDSITLSYEWKDGAVNLANEILVERYASDEHWEEEKERLEKLFQKARRRMPRKKKFEVWVESGDTRTGYV